MKKLNKLFAILVALAMMATLCVSMAFAAWTEGTDTEAKNAVLTKRVETPNETTLKEGSFVFTFVQKTADDKYTVSADAASLGTKTIEIKKANQVKDVDDKDVYVNTENLFENPKSVKSIFPHAGLYAYTVTETAGYTADTGETVHNSGAQYTVYVVVANTADNTDLYVKNIIVVKDKNDDGKANEDADKKKEITPGSGEDQKEDGTPIGSDFAFTNTYVKTNSTTPDAEEEPTTKDDTALYVQKIVDDTDAPGQIDLTKDFKFDVTVDLPSLASDDVKAIIVNVGEEVPANAQEITFKDNVSQEISLKHNQRLVFKALPVGTVYTATEKDLDTKTFTATTNATDTDKVTNPGVTEGVVKGTDTENNVIVTNKLNKSAVEPEGILISNLPYIALALVAIGGLVAYVVVRRRNADEA